MLEEGKGQLKEVMPVQLGSDSRSRKQGNRLRSLEVELVGFGNGLEVGGEQMNSYLSSFIRVEVVKFKCLKGQA